MKLKNRVGYVSNDKLGINKPGGHYVYVNKVSRDRKKVTVNTITSLDNSRNYNNNYQLDKLNKVRRGLILSLPKHRSSNFTKWSGVNKNGEKIVEARDINFNCNRSINSKWKSIINKFLK